MAEKLAASVLASLKVLSSSDLFLWNYSARVNSYFPFLFGLRNPIITNLKRYLDGLTWTSFGSSGRD